MHAGSAGPAGPSAPPGPKARRSPRPRCGCSCATATSAPASTRSRPRPGCRSARSTTGTATRRTCSCRCCGTPTTAMMATFRGIAEEHLGEVTDVQQEPDRVRPRGRAHPDHGAGPDRAGPADHGRGPVLSRAGQGGDGRVDHARQRCSPAWPGWPRQGRLAITDPAEAADHLLALTFNQINARTMFGVVPIGDAEVDRVRHRRRRRLRARLPAGLTQNPGALGTRAPGRSGRRPGVPRP